jgi:hypothetical protein
MTGSIILFNLGGDRSLKGTGLPPPGGLIILDLLISLIVSLFIKQYGEQYLEKLPKWSLSFVKYYLKARELSNYYLIVIMMLRLLLPTALYFYIYILEYINK